DDVGALEAVVVDVPVADVLDVVGAGGPLPRPELQALAHAGLVALVSDGWLTDPSLIRLMRMTLGAAPTGRVGPPALTPLSESFITAVPSIYPELSWLFG
ncbi:hypothetical protein ACQCQ6_14480, partial [Ralstonia pseudosolanacearum]